MLGRHLRCSSGHSGETYRAKPPSSQWFQIYFASGGSIASYDHPARAGAPWEDSIPALQSAILTPTSLCLLWVIRTLRVQRGWLSRISGSSICPLRFYVSSHVGGPNVLYSAEGLGWLVRPWRLGYSFVTNLVSDRVVICVALELAFTLLTLEEADCSPSRVPASCDQAWIERHFWAFKALVSRLLVTL